MRVQVGGRERLGMNLRRSEEGVGRPVGGGRRNCERRGIPDSVDGGELPSWREGGGEGQEAAGF